MKRKKHKSAEPEKKSFRKRAFHATKTPVKKDVPRTPFLPVAREDMAARGLTQLDIILITGDAYIDHPSFGAAIIGRVLESKGYSVGIIAQPDWKSVDDFKRLGQPRLFFGITSGNTDSMIANYTANKARRKSDDYAPGSVAGLRPDRALIVYASRAKEAFKGVPIVLGGIEASTRRAAHYDYWSDSVRHSVLLDAKADILVYGMGERQIVEIAERLDSDDPRGLDEIRGTVIVRKEPVCIGKELQVPSFEEVSAGKNKFTEAFMKTYAEMDPRSAKTVVQKDGGRYLIINPPAWPLSVSELDALYALPFARTSHPMYKQAGGIKALETIKFSITSHRGCCGECSFCSLYIHQGRIVQSRSKGSIVAEAKRIAALPDFRGTISDVGGPTVNLYMAGCRQWDNNAFCKERKCLMPKKCQNLRLAYKTCLELYRAVREIQGVKHVFLGSGFRHDLLTEKDSDKYLEEICARHISGLMKVAPEHCSHALLQLMNKPDFSVYETFVQRFMTAQKCVGKKLFLVNYFISAHPGSTVKEMTKLANYLTARKINPEQIQDYIPLPMTVSACMYYTGKDPVSGRSLYVPVTYKERQLQRALIQYGDKRNKRIVEKGLKHRNERHMASKSHHARRERRKK